MRDENLKMDRARWYRLGLVIGQSTREIVSGDTVCSKWSGKMWRPLSLCVMPQFIVHEHRQQFTTLELFYRFYTSNVGRTMWGGSW